MRCAVAMATCNGEKFLEEQLNSLLHQSRLPDRLVVHDDASDDRTLDMLNDFAAVAPFPVSIYARQTRIGANRNFTDALAQCTEDVIFICDQDDVWLPSKIEHIMRFFEGRPGSHAVATDAYICDSTLRHNGLRVSQTSGLRNGSCNAYSRGFVELALPVPTSSTSYDGWLYSLSGWMGLRYESEEVHQLWRRHSGALSGWREARTTKGGRSSGAMLRLSQLRRTVRAEKRGRILAREARNLKLMSARLDAWIDDPLRDQTLDDAVLAFVDSIWSRQKVVSFREELLVMPLPRRALQVSKALATRRFGEYYSWRAATVDLLTQNERT
ncbi:glycosyltransferase [Nostocoides sp. F2B08]|uniref:glycosyltransferase n=1 Tax=Nostocoides sp. F2B08 TaxID=2653936 RepID=UPI001263182D|nr:glycosyltransferase [Tetrasphaera sp. F2B08]